MEYRCSGTLRRLRSKGHNKKVLFHSHHSLSSKVPTPAARRRLVWARKRTKILAPTPPLKFPRKVTITSEIYTVGDFRGRQINYRWDAIKLRSKRARHWAIQVFRNFLSRCGWNTKKKKSPWRHNVIQEPGFQATFVNKNVTMFSWWIINHKTEGNSVHWKKISRKICFPL